MKNLYIILLLFLVACSQNSDNTIDLNLLSNKKIASFKDTTFVFNMSDLKLIKDRDTSHTRLVDWCGKHDGSSLQINYLFNINYPTDSILGLYAHLYTAVSQSVKDSLKFEVDNNIYSSKLLSVDTIVVDSLNNKIDYSSKVLSLKYMINFTDLKQLNSDSLISINLISSNFDTVIPFLSNTSRITVDSANIQPKIELQYFSLDSDTTTSLITYKSVSKEYTAISDYVTIESSSNDSSYLLSSISGSRVVLNTDSLYDITLNTVKVTIYLEGELKDIINDNRTNYPGMISVYYGSTYKSLALNDSTMSSDITEFLVNGIKNGIDLYIEPNYSSPHLYSINLNDIKIKIEASVLDE